MPAVGFQSDAAGPYIEAAPNEYDYYVFDWTAPLGVGETITSAQWTVPTGVTLGTTSVMGNLTIGWITSGTTPGAYWILITVTLSTGRILPRSFRLIIAENI